MKRLRRLIAAIGAVLALQAQAALPIEHWTHASGAKVYLVNSPAIPMLDVQVEFDAGGRREPAGQAGLAGATAMLLGRGVEAGPQGPALDENALDEAWMELGAQFGASAGADRLGFSLRTLTAADLLPRAVALAARQMAMPSFDAAVWARERDRLLAAKREAETRPGTHAGRAFSRAVYGDHPYGRESTEQTLRAIDVAAIRDFYRRHVMACGAHVTLVGAVDRAQADGIVTALMRAIAAHGCRTLPAVPEVAALTAPRQERIPFETAQAQVLLGQPGIRRADPDYLALLVGNHILGGGGFNSRLMAELREKRGLTYGAYSYFSPGRHAGAFTVGVQTRPDQADQALTLARDVVARYVAEGPSDAELQAAKDFLIKGFALRLDSNRKLLDNVTALGWNGLPLDYLDTWTTQVGALTREQVHAALKRALQPDRMVSVVVGAKP
jgi:zinc protease